MTNAEQAENRLLVIKTYQEQLAKGLPKRKAQQICAETFDCSVSKVQKAVKAAKLTRSYVRDRKPALRPDQKIVILPFKLVQQVGDLLSLNDTCYLVVNIPTGIATRVIDKAGVHLLGEVGSPVVKDEVVEIPTDGIIPALDSIAKSAPYNERQTIADALVSKMTNNQKARIKYLLFHQLKKEHYLTVGYRAFVKAIEGEECKEAT